MLTFDPEVTAPIEYSVHITPWLRSWEPLMEWLHKHGIESTNCYGFALMDEGTTARFEMYHRDRQGNRMIDPRTLKDPGGPEALVTWVTKPITSLPPYRTPSGRVLR